MAPIRVGSRNYASVVSLAPALVRLVHEYLNNDPNKHRLSKRVHGGERVAFIILIPVLVLLSGLFAGLTLGYMSLDETQLNVLSVSGTPYVVRKHSLTCHLPNFASGSSKRMPRKFSLSGRMDTCFSLRSCSRT
jgi:hypothetical protein